MNDYSHFSTRYLQHFALRQLKECPKQQVENFIKSFIEKKAIVLQQCKEEIFYIPEAVAQTKDGPKSFKNIQLPLSWNFYFCLTDIPEAQWPIEAIKNIFGNLCIFFEKEWLVSQGAGQVKYVNLHSPHYGLYLKLYEHANCLNSQLKELPEELKAHVSENFVGVIDSLMFIKMHDEIRNTPPTPYHEGYIYRSENEWRLVDRTQKTINIDPLKVKKIMVPELEYVPLVKKAVKKHWNTENVEVQSANG